MTLEANEKYFIGQFWGCGWGFIVFRPTNNLNWNLLTQKIEPNKDKFVSKKGTTSFPVRR